VVGKLCSSRRQQNALTSAIKEYGALRRTVYAARYLADETYRRRIARQLNKGENLHALRRALAYAGEGAVRRPHHEQQTEQMWCLTLATNAIVTWTTEYHGLAVAALRRAGRHIDDEVLAHIWPTHHETSTSTAPTRSTSTGNWPSSTPTGTGRCTSRRSGEAPSGHCAPMTTGSVAAQSGRRLRAAGSMPPCDGRSAVGQWPAARRTVAGRAAGHGTTTRRLPRRSVRCQAVSMSVSGTFSTSNVSPPDCAHFTTCP
jgi:Tn3 transposase DDE domain